MPIENDGYERACEPGGNYGLCRTHPTCELVRNKLQALADAKAAEVDSHDALLAACKAALVKLEGALPYVKEHIPRCEINAAIEELTTAIAAAEGTDR